MATKEQPVSNPRYRILAEALREAIVAGEYPPGGQLPTEAELAKRFGMSRGTVVKAIDTLVAEGIVIKRQGAGSFVAVPALHRRSSRLMSFTETVSEQGRTSSQKVLSYGRANKEEARAYGSHEPSMLLTRLRFVDRVAASIHRSFIPERVLEQLSAEDSVNCSRATRRCMPLLRMPGSRSVAVRNMSLRGLPRQMKPRCSTSRALRR
ncbi:GntR family transcriptional regulator [Hoeflea alexandrii]|uniref:GntR family transcriptional regulator n=1 Tax=Hoeflea alexandrii TaxID=288436 RepID=UPI0035CFB74F